MADRRKIVEEFIKNRNKIVSSEVYNIIRTARRARYTTFNTFYKFLVLSMSYLLICKLKVT